MPVESNKGALYKSVAEFGQFILVNQEQITRRWVTVVDRSARIPSSDELTYQQVLDHLPALCTELGLLLTNFDATAIQEQAARDAGRHGIKRWQQGYELAEVITEICLIRNEVLGNWLKLFARTNSDFDVNARELANELVRRFFDQVIIDSTVQFVEEKGEAPSQTQTKGNDTQSAEDRVRTDLFRRVSDTLRGPLAAIVFAAECLDGEELPHSAKEYVDVILRNARIEADNVDQLILAAHLDASTGTPVPD